LSPTLAVRPISDVYTHRLTDIQTVIHKHKHRHPQVIVGGV